MLRRELLEVLLTSACTLAAAARGGANRRAHPRGRVAQSDRLFLLSSAFTLFTLASAA